MAAAIIAKVDVMPESTDYLFGGGILIEWHDSPYSFFSLSNRTLLLQGLIMAALFALLPIVYRINGTVRAAAYDFLHPVTFEKTLHSASAIGDVLLGTTRW